MEDFNEALTAIADRTAQLALDLATLHCSISLEDKDGKYATVTDEIRQFSDEMVERYYVISGALDTALEEDVAEWLEVYETADEDESPTIESLIENDPRSMTQFAKDAGITRDTLKRFLTGEAAPHTKTLRGIEKALDLPEGTLDV